MEESTHSWGWVMHCSCTHLFILYQKLQAVAKKFSSYSMFSISRILPAISLMLMQYLMDVIVGIRAVQWCQSCKQNTIACTASSLSSLHSRNKSSGVIFFWCNFIINGRLSLHALYANTLIFGGSFIFHKAFQSDF